MQDSKLIAALRLLSGRKSSRFADFLVSPYFNKNKEIVHFYNYLSRFAPAYESAQLDKAAVVKSLSFLKKTGAQKLPYLMNQLLQLLEQFQILEFHNEHNLEGRLHLAGLYHQSKLESHYNHTLSRVERDSEKEALRNSSYYFRHFQLEKCKYETSATTRRDKNPALQKTSDALDAYYLMEKLRLSCEMLNYEKTLNIQYDIRWVEWVRNAVQEREEDWPPGITIYALLFKMLDSRQALEPYFQLKSALDSYAEIFPERELKNLYTYLLNFCTRRITRAHDKQFEKEYFELNKRLLKKKLLLENNRLSPWRYSNLVTIALRLQAFDWTYTFINKYKSYLPSEAADNLYAYKIGQYHFVKENWDEAQQSLAQVDLHDPLLALSVKILLAKIYYEKEESELLLSHLEAFRIYLLRDAILKPQLKDQVKLFIAYTRKLVKTPAFEREKLRQLLSELPPAQLIMHRDWLAQKINAKLGNG